MVGWGILGVLAMIGVVALLWVFDVVRCCNEAADEALESASGAHQEDDGCRARCSLSRDTCRAGVLDGKYGNCDRDAQRCTQGCEGGVVGTVAEDTPAVCVERCRVMGRKCMAAADSEENYDGCQVSERMCETDCARPGTL